MCSSPKQDSGITTTTSKTTTITKTSIGRTISQSSNTTVKNARNGCIQTRYIILLLCCLTNAISYTMRLDLNMTIVAMVKEEMPSVNNGTDLDSCPSNEIINNEPQQNYSQILTSTTVQPNFLRLFEVTPKGFDWSESLVGVILGAFYYGYILTMAYGGQLADLVGTKLLVAISMTACALGTLAIPISAQLHPSLVITVRIVTGLAQGVVTPALYTILPRWMPTGELGLAFGLIVASGNLGAVLTMPICGLLSQYASWPWVFYLFGSVALLFTLPWLYLVYNEPQSHPRISPTERVYITSNLSISSSSNKKKALVPWRSILSSPKIWAIAVTRFCNGWGSLFLVSKLPSYLSKVLHMPMTYNGYVNASIYITLGLSSLLWGYVSDVVGRKRLVSKTASRKAFQSIALLGGALFLALIPVAGCNIAAIVLLLNLSMLVIGLTAGGEFLIVVDVAPNYSGSIYGFTNAIASLPGFLAPLFVGLMLDQPNVNLMRQWNILFGIGAAIYAFGAVVFLFGVNSEPEKWGRALSMSSGNNQQQQESTSEKEQQQTTKNNFEKSDSVSISQQVVNTDLNNNNTTENMA